jgi:integrase
MAKAKGIYKRGRIWWIRYAGPDGRIKFESSRSSSHKDATALLVRRKKEVMEGKNPITARRIKNHTFKELADSYLKWAQRQKSFQSKQGFILQLVGTFGSLPLRFFTTKLVEEFQSQRLAKGNKPATANRLLSTLKHMFTKAVDWEMVEEEALKRVRKVKQLRENNRRLRFLSQEEMLRLVENSSPHLRPIVLTALNTGMRKSEILKLRWDQVDFKHGFILLEITKSGERREIPINLLLRRTLQRIPRGLNNPYVFTNEKGKPFKDVKGSFKTALRRAGIKDFKFHDLRHTFASHLVMEGIDLTTVKELLGHKTLTMTLRYAHLAPGHKARAISVLEKLLDKKKPTIQKLYNLEETNQAESP